MRNRASTSNMNPYTILLSMGLVSLCHLLQYSTLGMWPPSSSRVVSQQYSSSGMASLKPWLATLPSFVNQNCMGDWGVGLRRYTPFPLHCGKPSNWKCSGVSPMKEGRQLISFSLWAHLKMLGSLKPMFSSDKNKVLNCLIPGI